MILNLEEAPVLTCISKFSHNIISQSIQFHSVVKSSLILELLLWKIRGTSVTYLIILNVKILEYICIFGITKNSIINTK